MTKAAEPQGVQATYAVGDKVQNDDGNIGIVLASYKDPEYDPARHPEHHLLYLVGWFDTGGRHYLPNELASWHPGHPARDLSNRPTP